MKFSPTVAWGRASVLGILVVTLGAVAGRTDLVLLATPLLVWTAWAYLSRPTGSMRLVTLPRGRASAVEGTPIPARVATDHHGPLLITAAWPNLTDATFDPPHGCRTTVCRPGQECRVSIDPRRWGTVQLGPAQVAVQDVSGAWRASGRSAIVRATLRPAAATLQGPTDVARPIGIAGVHTSARRGEGSSLAEVRPFQVGDRLRRINWRVTSRTGDLHVTSTLTDRDTDVLVIADSLHDSGGPELAGPSPLDETARAVVAISRYYLALGDRVALSDVGPRLRSLPPGTGLKQARRIVDALSQAARDQVDGGEFRSRVARVTPGSLIFVCSPLLQRAVLDEVVRLRRLGGEVVVVDTLPESMGAGALAYASDVATTAEAWHLRWLEREEPLQRLRGIGVPVTPWRGPTSLATVLLAMEAARSAPRPGACR